MLTRRLMTVALLSALAGCGEGELSGGELSPDEWLDAGVTDDATAASDADAPDPSGRTDEGASPLDAGAEDAEAWDAEAFDAERAVVDAGLADAEVIDAEPAEEDMALEPPAVCARLKVNVPADEVLNIRPMPSTQQAPVGSLPRGYVVAAHELVHGQAVEGEDRWYGIESPRGDGYVHFDFVECTDDPITVVPLGYYMPFACGAQHRVTQGPGGGTSHGGNASQAYDFACGLNTSVRAMMGGTVGRVWMETGPGDACYNGGGSGCSQASNHIMIHHPNGQTTLYKHLNSASVGEGSQVSQGQEIGLSGTTGWSTGPHLHIGVCNGASVNQFCQTVDFAFEDIGRPGNVNVRSGNCP